MSRVGFSSSASVAARNNTETLTASKSNIDSEVSEVRNLQELILSRITQVDPRINESNKKQNRILSTIPQVDPRIDESNNIEKECQLKLHALRILEQQLRIINTAKFFLRCIQRELNYGEKIDLSNLSYNKGDIDKEFFKELYNSPEIITKFQMICRDKPTNNMFEKLANQVVLFAHKGKTKYSQEAQGFKNFLDDELSKLKRKIQSPECNSNLSKRLRHEYEHPLQQNK